MDPNKLRYFGCGPNRFGAPKMLPIIVKWSKHFTKEPPECEKELQKPSLFGVWPGGLREALTIIVSHPLLFHIPIAHGR